MEDARRHRTMMGTNGNGHIKYLKPVFNVTRDISHLSRWKQWLYWTAFVPLLRVGFWLGMPVLVDKDGARVDIQTVADTDAIASAVVASIGPSAFYIKQVPRNVNLPVAPVVFGGTRAPYSEVAELHESAGRREDITFICPTTRELCTRSQHESIPRQKVVELYEQVKSAVAS